MSWSTVQSAIEFYDGTQGWGSLLGFDPVSGSDQTAILAALQNMYLNSSTAAAAMDAAVQKGPLRIGHR